MKWVAFHGFSGSSRQFDFLKGKDVLHFPIEAFLDNSINEMTKYLKEKITNEKINLIGYSFGSRMAMQVFNQIPDRINHMFCLAGHCGLENQNDRIQRQIIEDTFVNKLNSSDKEQFENYWNSLDIFKADNFIEFNHYNKKILSQYFLNWGLSKQPYLLNILKIHKNKITFFYGEKDIKYRDYAHKYLNEFKVHFLPKTGHRVYQSEEFYHLWKQEYD